MKPAFGKSLTHIAAAGIGLLIAASVGVVVADRRGGSEKSAAVSGNGGAGSMRPDRPDRPDRPAQTKAAIRGPQAARFTAKECKAAWDAIGRRDLTKEERLNLQRQVLTAWAEVDPEAALKAALSVPWDNDRSEYALLGAFYQYFQKQPIESWDLIKSGRLGLGAELVKIQWAHSVSRENPTLVLSYFGEFADSQKMSLLQDMAMLVKNDPEKRDAFLAKFLEFEDNKQFSGWVHMLAQTLGNGESPTELREKLAAADTPQKVTLYLHQLGYSMRGSDIEAIRDEWSKLPAEMQGRALRAITLHADPDGTKNTPALFDMLVGVKEWEFMKTEKWRLARYAQTPEKKEELAKWALKLPESPQTQEIFHRAIDPYIRADLDKAGDWIETLPQGWQRDRALAELSQQALWRKNNTELSDWALNAISDPKLRQDATSWRGAWARQTGRGK